MDAVLTSLIVTGNYLVSLERVLLVVPLDPSQTDLISCMNHDRTSIGLGRGKLHRPVESVVVNINKNTKVIKEIPTNDYIVGT